MIKNVIFIPTQEVFTLKRGITETLSTYISSYIVQFKKTRKVVNSNLGELIIKTYLLSGKDKRLTRSHFGVID
tara:strand:+ start:140 stop:358 length:219 start_codon:yes stop_codon:yes gene_type:complete